MSVAVLVNLALNVKSTAIYHHRSARARGGSPYACRVYATRPAGVSASPTNPEVQQWPTIHGHHAPGLAWGPTKPASRWPASPDLAMKRTRHHPHGTWAADLSGPSITRPPLPWTIHQPSVLAPATLISLRPNNCLASWHHPTTPPPRVISKAATPAPPPQH